MTSCNVQLTAIINRLAVMTWQVPFHSLPSVSWPEVGGVLGTNTGLNHTLGKLSTSEAHPSPPLRIVFPNCLASVSLSLGDRCAFKVIPGSIHFFGDESHCPHFNDSVVT